MRMRRWKGLFIAFEGIDGAGLTTHSRMVERWLIEERGMEKVLLTKEPTDSMIGFLLRGIMSRQVSITPYPHVMALLFAADRLYHLYEDPYGPGPRHRGILSALKEGYVVISDRYVVSSMAYQGGRDVGALSLSVDLDWVREVNRYAPLPDVVVYLDVPPEVSTSRIRRSRWTWQIYENRADLMETYRNFRRLLDDLRAEGVTVVEVDEVKDGRERGVEEVQAEIRARLEEVLEEFGLSAVESE